MEPQDEVYCYDCVAKKENRKNCFECFGITIIILLVAFAFVLGLVIGATISETILGALAAIIVLEVVLGLLLILNIILYICNQNRTRKHKKYC